MFVKTFSKILCSVVFLLLVAGGLTGCSSSGDPQSRFVIYGQVVDADTKAPVADIKVFIDKKLNGTDVVGLDTLFTDGQGKFHFDRTMQMYPIAEIGVALTDENGVYPEMVLENLIFTQDMFSGASGDWNYGTATRDLGVIQIKQ